MRTGTTNHNPPVKNSLVVTCMRKRQQKLLLLVLNIYIERESVSKQCSFAWCRSSGLILDICDSSPSERSEVFEYVAGVTRKTSRLLFHLLERHTYISWTISNQDLHKFFFTISSIYWIARGSFCVCVQSVSLVLEIDNSHTFWQYGSTCIEL